MRSARHDGINDARVVMDLNEDVPFTSSVTKPLPLLVEDVPSPVSAIQIDQAKGMHIKNIIYLKFTHSLKM